MSIAAWLKHLYYRHDLQTGRSAPARPFQPLLEELETRRLLAVHVVSNTLDTGAGSLRQALLDANNDHDATSAIMFNIPGTGQQMIQPASALPTPTRALTIDGTSQPSAPGSLAIVLDGSGAGTNVDGLTISAGHSTIKGLVISHFRDGIVLQTNGGNVVEGNFIGTDATGSAALPNRQNGIVIQNGSADNTIGGTDAGAGNIISANGTDSNDIDQSGILLVGMGVTGNQILGNYLGTDGSGTVAMGNVSRGVYIKDGAAGNTVGGTAYGAGNIIAANHQAGVQIDTSTGNLVQGNFIGVDAYGVDALPNGEGILISGGSGNTIGGVDPGAGNVISGNTGGGVSILGSGGNLVAANWIGLDATGGTQLGNGATTDGVFIYGTAPNNVITGNTIDASRYGIWISGSQATGNRVEGNFIGTDASGTVALANGSDGVLLSAPGNTVGGTASGAGNVISGCGADGVQVYNSTMELVEGNFLGTDVTGTVAIPNRYHGVEVDGSSGVTVLANILSGNTLEGVALVNDTHTVIQGNYIGVDVSGVNALANGEVGISISGGNLNTVGGSAAGAGNVLSANAVAGVQLFNGTFGDVIQGNYIGLGADGATPLGNGQYGVLIYNNAQNNLIGGVLPGEGNVISYTTAGSGVGEVLGPGNSIRQNAIWGNADHGILLGGSGVPSTPVLTSAVIGARGLTVAGTYTGSPYMAYALEFFANDQANPTGGEGQYYLGTLTVVTNGAGTASFNTLFDATVYAGQYISATATTPVQTTSQFAADVVATAPPNLARQPQAVTTATAELAGSLPRVTHAATMRPAAADHQPVARTLPPTGAEGAGVRLETGSQHFARPLAQPVAHGIDGVFEQWDKLF